MTAKPEAGGTRPPIFVERRTYRLRRLQDAMRAIPVLALMLFSLPLLWGIPGAAVSASSVLVFLFGTWLGLSLAAAGLGWALVRAEARAASDDRARSEGTGPAGPDAAAAPARNVEQGP